MKDIVTTSSAVRPLYVILMYMLLLISGERIWPNFRASPQPNATPVTCPIITLCTHLSINKLDRLVLLAERWQGPLSASLFLPPTFPLSTAHDVIDTLFKLSPAIKSHVSIHLVQGESDSDDLYPTNLMRNVAIQFAHSAYVLVNDVDFIIGPHDAYHWIQYESPINHHLPTNPLATGLFAP